MANKKQWSNTWDDNSLTPEEALLKEAKENYRLCTDWEATARVHYENDTKFANGDSYNNYQWPQDIYNQRNAQAKPCLTMNKTQQHNLMIINDAKQNKPGVRIRPVGDEATFEGAQIFQELVYHIEYISNAEHVYDHATTTQVNGGIGYWRVCVDYIDDKSFDQEIYIRQVKDPMSVYLDPYIDEPDGSDARFGFVFEDMPKKLFAKKHPKFADVGGSSVFQNNGDGWITRDNIRVVEYYRKEEKQKTLVTFLKPNEDGSNEQIQKYTDDFDDMEKIYYQALKGSNDQNKAMYMFNQRKVVTEEIRWYKIAGDTIIDEGPWLGKFIPIVRVVGIETVIDGILDRKGHTRSLLDAQRVYNYATSASTEFIALQSKSPWVASQQAVEGFEEYYRTANIKNHAWLPYNAVDEDGNPLAPPTRPAAPSASPGYVAQMQSAQNEMMMVTGQYQSQMGENENAKSGVAINARQRQGDRATYHFIDNQAIAIRYTGKILIDLIPKVYDTPRVLRLTTTDGKRMNVNIDPYYPEASKNVTDPSNPEMDKGQKIEKIFFNPSFGQYDIQADTGPSFATRRQEAFNALTEVAKGDKNFMNVAGDIYFKVADFPEADILAQRYRNVIPPNILGEKPNPQTEKMMNDASNKIEQLTKLITEQAAMLKDKQGEIDVRNKDIDKRTQIAGYDAETKRLTALGNSEPGVSKEQIQPMIKQLLREMLEGAPLDGAKKADDGSWYMEHPEQKGQFLRIDNNVQQPTG